ncbi:hypothetical protein CDD83_7550 [Cordyceps sp. RAO-2017]|nr:hypothetical protein CDD83_7550 [Cordyceps sp. RAO-2017]
MRAGHANGTTDGQGPTLSVKRDGMKKVEGEREEKGQMVELGKVVGDAEANDDDDDATDMDSPGHGQVEDAAPAATTTAKDTRPSLFAK